MLPFNSFVTILKTAPYKEYVKGGAGYDMVNGNFTVELRTYDYRNNQFLQSYKMSIYWKGLEIYQGILTLDTGNIRIDGDTVVGGRFLHIGPSGYDIKPHRIGFLGEDSHEEMMIEILRMM